MNTKRGLHDSLRSKTNDLKKYMNTKREITRQLKKANIRLKKVYKIDTMCNSKQKSKRVEA